MVNSVTSEFLNALEAQLPANTLKPVTPAYLEEPRERFHGHAGGVAAPRNADEVSVILKAANDAQVAIVPYGGGTGLVAGQIMQGDVMPLLLSLERMNAVRAIYPEEDVMVAEAGVTVEALHKAAEGADRLFPLSYASQGTAQIGSGLSVNSGGTAVLRYGNARDLCLGIEAVLPDGTVFDGLKRLRKDNTGYDIRNLLIGAEGTLGVITAASLRLYPIPAHENAALFTVASPKAALTLLSMTRAHVGQNVSGFELLSGVGMGFLEETSMAPRWPLAQIPEWAVLLDLGLPPSEDPDKVLEGLFEEGLSAELVSDGVLAQSETQRRAFWTLRETIPLANRAIGAVASHDISLPLSEIPDFLAEMTPRLENLAALRVNAFGHLGDGNLHYNVFPQKGHDRSEFDDLREEIMEIVHDRVMELGGSFSAEHGVGRLKTGDLEKYGDPGKLAAMRAIKAALDPNGIMNPGAVLRQG